MLDTADGGTRPALSVLQTGLNWFDSGSGGLDRVYRDLAETLPEFGIRVTGAVLEPAGVEALTEGRIRTLAPPGASLPGRLIGARRTIGRMIGSGEFDLVAGHFALHLATALDRLQKLPLVVHFHGPWAAESRCEGQSWVGVAAKRAVETLVYRRADRIITLSQAFADLVCRRYGVAEERIRVVPGSIDLPRFEPHCTQSEARYVLDWPTDRFILLAVRRLTPRMGLGRLIAALERLIIAEPALLLYIAGRGPAEAALRAQAAAAGLDRHVRFLGFLPDELLPLAYRAADVNVVPSAALEGFGLIAAEALAAGVPSMVTPIGGLPEVVSGLSKDLVFPSCSVDGLVTGLRRVLSGTVRLPSPAACRDYAERHFDRSLASSRVAEIYREVAA